MYFLTQKVKTLSRKKREKERKREKKRERERERKKERERERERGGCDAVEALSFIVEMAGASLGASLGTRRNARCCGCSSSTSSGSRFRGRNGNGRSVDDGISRKRERRSKRRGLIEKEGGDEGEGQRDEESYAAAVRPVFRTTTLVAERRRKQVEDEQFLEGNKRKLKVLFVEEGLGCRSVLAKTIFSHAVAKSKRLSLPGSSFVETDVAAILPHSVAMPIEADKRALDMTRRHGLKVEFDPSVPENKIRPFDDVNDSVNFDLIVVMDRFDHAEVLKEVAAYDNIFPGGYYALKVRRLAGFKACNESHCIVQQQQPGGFVGGASDGSSAAAAYAKGEDGLDISDPLYTCYSCDLSQEEEEDAFEMLYAEISEACEGLVHFISQLQEVADLKGTQLAHEIATNLKTNDIALGSLAKRATRFSDTSASSLGARGVRNNRNGGRQGGVHYINSNGEAVLLDGRKPQTKSRGYWMNMENVKKELIAWSEDNNRTPGIMPIVEDIKNSGSYMIFHSITKYHGGKGSVASRLGWKLDKRVSRGFWSKEENIIEALSPYLDCEGSGKEGEEEECTIPTKSSLIERGRQDLVGAIDRVGGFKAVAQHLNLKIRHPGRKPRYPELKDWEIYKQKLELWVKRQEGEDFDNRMPKMREMMSNDAMDLHYATKKYHGGSKRVAEKMGWQK